MGKRGTEHKQWWWLSTLWMTVMVSEIDGVIVDAPPIVRKFKGQSVNNLKRWMYHQPGFLSVRSGEME